MDALHILRNLAARTASLMKGASFVNSEGKNIELVDKTQIAKSKKEVRDASYIFFLKCMNLSPYIFFTKKCKNKSQKRPPIYTAIFQKVGI